MAARARRQSVSAEAPRWAESLPDDFLLCRDVGHVWKAHTARWISEDGTFERTLRCGRCHALRDQILSASGHPLRHSYRYPEGYLAPRGTGHLDGADRDSLRLVSVTRFLESEPLRKREARRR